VERAAEILGAELGWDEERRKGEIAEYQRWLGHLAVPVVTSPTTTTTPVPAAPSDEEHSS